MNPKPKIKSGEFEKNNFSPDIVNLKLFMLNIHKIIACGLKLRHTFEDLKQKYEGDYIYGRMFIAETIIYIVDTLDIAIFYLNVLAEGNNIDLYRKIDDLRGRLNRVFEGNPDATLHLPDDSPGKPDALAVLLRNIMIQSAEVSPSAESTGFADLEDILTACDLLYYCYNRLLDILNKRYESIVSDAGEIPAPTIPIIGIPLSYLQHDGKIVMEKGLPFNDSPDISFSNPGALALGKGIFEVLDSEIYSDFREHSLDVINIRGMMLYSNEILALYLKSDKYKFLIAANICDAVGGNYINLLISSAVSSNDSPSSHRLLGKLLNWLDFHSFGGYGFTTASIENLSRNEMENHLNTLGKLLSFVSAIKIPPGDDLAQQKLEYFMENVV